MNQMSDWYSIHPETSPYLTKNLNTLKTRYPDLTKLVEASSSKLREYEFQNVKQGQIACRHNTGGQWVDVYSPNWFVQELEPQFRRIKEMLHRGAELVFIAGSGLGYLNSDLQDCLEKTNKTSVILMENRPELTLAQLCLFDCKQTLEYVDFHWITGDTFFQPLEECLKDEALFSVNRNRIASFPERMLTADERNQYMQLNNWFTEKQLQFTNQQNQLRIQYEQRVNQPADLQNGLIWTASMMEAYAHTPLLRSLASGFSAHGMKDVFFPLSRGRTSNERITQSLLEHCPDVYLFLHLASTRVIPAEINRPRIIWYLDHPKHYEWDINKDQFYENDFVFYSDKKYSPYFEKISAGGTYHLTVCPSLKHKGRYRKELEAPVMFVGSHTPVEIMTKSLHKKIRDDLLLVANELTNEPTLSVEEAVQRNKLSDPTYHEFQVVADRFTSTIERDFHSAKEKLEYFFYALTNCYKREKYINALLDLGLVIYGPESWLHFLGNNYADRYRGWLNYENLADAYASADVCINIHSLQCPTCLNSRDFDVLIAGGCLVSDEVDDMHEGYLTPNHDLKMYHSPENLVNAVQELLENKELRNTLREQGHQTVQSRHLPKNRAQEILQAIHSTGWR